MKEHVEEEHKEKEVDPKDTENKSHAIQCVVCLEQFPSNVKLEEHKEAEHKEQNEEKGQYQTTLSQQVDEEVDDSVNSEEVLIQKSLEFKCEICRIYFEQMKELEHHLDDIHLDELNCVFCKIEFPGINDMDNHMDLRHKGMWKLNDPDILREGDSEYENEFEEN